MPKKSHKFIDKDKALFFRLVCRSQQDPLTADETAPQHVLVQQTHKGRKPRTGDDIEQHKDELRAVGVYFDEEYDYIQELRDADGIEEIPVAGLLTNPTFGDSSKSENESRLMLPSSAFASNVEEKIGLLNKAAPMRGPQPDFDPDIVNALFDNDKCYDIFDDDFMKKLQAKSPESENKEDEEEFEYDFGKSERLDQILFDQEETKSRFTNYSLTSSVIKRNAALTLLDERFEKFFEKYDEDSEDAQEDEDIMDNVKPDGANFDKALKDFEDNWKDPKVSLADIRTELKAPIVEINSKEKKIDVVEKPPPKWDCVSILSTYSTLYNHPRLITEPPKTKLKPASVLKDVLKPKRLTAANLARLNKSDHEEKNDDEGTTVDHSRRPRDETPEQKKERKRAVQEQKRERRIEKKANTIAFKEKDQQYSRDMINLRQNVRGIKLA